MAEQADSHAHVLGTKGCAQLWPIERPRATWLGLAILAVVVIANILLMRRVLVLAGTPFAALVGLAAAVACTLTAAWAARLHGALTLHYVLDGRALTIARGTSHWVVPLAVIARVYRGEQDAELVYRDWLPGFRLGRGYVKDRGKALFFSTLPGAASVAVETADCTYILSPAAPDAFVRALEEQRQTAVEAAAREPGPGLLSVLQQPPAIALIMAAAVLAAGLYAYIAWWLPVLPNVPVHFTATGLPDGWAAPTVLFRLPLLGAAVLAANVLLALLPPLRHALTTYVLLVTALAVQVFSWAAFLLLLPR